MSALDKIFQYVDDHQELYIKRLSDSVAIQSVSAVPEKRGECKRMMEVTAKQLKEQLGCTVELRDLGKHRFKFCNRKNQVFTYLKYLLTK